MIDNRRTVLIIGGGGFMGFYLRKVFLKRGYVVLTADINGADIKMNITDYGQVKWTLEKVQPDIIFNLAGISFIPDNQNSEMAYKINVDGTDNIFRAAIELEIKPLIQLTSSSDVYGKDCICPKENRLPLHPISDYGKSKLIMEEFAKYYQKEHEFIVIIIRPFNHTGPRQNEKFMLPGFCKRVIEIEKGLVEPILLHGDLSTRRDITDVKDMAWAYFLIIERGKTGIFNIGSGKNYSGYEILELIRKCSGIKFINRPCPEKMRPSEIKSTLCDNTHFKKITGWEISCKIEDTINDLLNYYDLKVKAKK
jgi:GDP-4-dehydro-6-deoxy-D-mannose reductase